MSSTSQFMNPQNWWCYILKQRYGIFTRVASRARLTRLAKSMLRTGTATLWLGHGTRERPRTCAHLDGAVAGGAHVCVHTNTAVQVNGQPRRALAAERTLRVQTAAIHADTCCLALIDVCENKRKQEFIRQVLLWDLWPKWQLLHGCQSERMVCHIKRVKVRVFYSYMIFCSSWCMESSQDICLQHINTIW